MTVLCEHDCADKWKEIAIGLQLSRGTISSIENSKDSDVLKLSEVLHKWKEQETMPFTMDSIINVMEGPIVNNKAVANKLREQTRPKDRLQHQVTSNTSLSYIHTCIVLYTIYVCTFTDLNLDIEHTDLAVSDVSGRQIGKLSYNEEDLLGKGSYGTFVYQ